MRLADQYAQFLYGMELREDSSRRFVALLEKRGHQKLLPAIIQKVERLTLRHNKIGKTTLTIAKESDAPSALKEVSSYGTPQVTTIDPSIIGGWRFRSTATLVDRTYKRMLLDLYRNVTS